MREKMVNLIDRQVAIDELKEHRALYCDNTPDTFSKLSYAEKCRVDELDEAIATLVNLPSAQPEPRWIPVIEPPEYSGRFICYYENEEFGGFGHCIDFGRYDEDDGWYVSGVKYWMPLPDEPYERSEE